MSVPICAGQEAISGQVSPVSGGHGGWWKRLLKSGSLRGSVSGRKSDVLAASVYSQYSPDAQHFTCTANARDSFGVAMDGSSARLFGGNASPAGNGVSSNKVADGRAPRLSLGAKPAGPTTMPQSPVGPSRPQSALAQISHTASGSDLSAGTQRKAAGSLQSARMQLPDVALAQPPAEDPQQPCTYSPRMQSVLSGSMCGTPSAAAASSMHVRCISGEATSRAATRSSPQVVVASPTSPAPTITSPAPATASPTPPRTCALLAASPAIPAAMCRPVWSLDDYEVAKRIFKSASSAVYRATCRHSGLPVALKVYFLSKMPSNVVHMVVREIAIQSELVHKHIVTLYGAFQDDRRLVLVQEWAAQGDLYQVHRSLKRRMNEEQLAVVVMRPLLDALSYLHARGICHRDIKPENILFTQDWRLVVADFGVAINLNTERAVTRAGTLEYMAPEVERCPLKMYAHENKDVPSLAYTTAVDVWAAGVLAYELLVGFSPFVLQKQQRHACPGGGSFLATQGSPKTLSFPSSTSSGVRDLISSALSQDASMRPTAAQLLRHPWLCELAGATAETLPRRSSAGGQQRATPGPSGATSPPAARGSNTGAAGGDCAAAPPADAAPGKVSIAAAAGGQPARSQ